MPSQSFACLLIWTTTALVMVKVDHFYWIKLRPMEIRYKIQVFRERRVRGHVNCCLDIRSMQKVCIANCSLRFTEKPSLNSRVNQIYMKSFGIFTNKYYEQNFPVHELTLVITSIFSFFHFFDAFI